tara:strand:+ start:633 stop:1097 length:465 start_codon:yes stop_codon:yes gene_type:complete
MSCATYCTVAAALLVGNIAVSASSESSIRESGLMSTLGPGLQKQYKKSVAERRLLYYTGLGWGLLCAALTSYARRGERARLLHVGCLAAAITLGVGYVYYMVMPKRHSVHPHLKTEKQRAAWGEVHRRFKRNYMIGLVLGGLAGGFLGAGVCGG